MTVVRHTDILELTCVVEDDKREELYSFLSGHLKENCKQSGHQAQMFYEPKLLWHIVMFIHWINASEMLTTLKRNSTGHSGTLRKDDHTFIAFSWLCTFYSLFVAFLRAFLINDTSRSIAHQSIKLKTDISAHHEEAITGFERPYPLD